MKFEEKSAIKIDEAPLCLIYFLLYNNEVVYVGQTIRGACRVYEHTDKKFDSAYYIECSEDELNELEGRYIIKYNPKYNKALNAGFISAQNIAREVNKKYFSTSTRRITRKPIIKICEHENYEMFNYCGNTYVLEKTAYEILANIDDYKKGAPLDEIYNFGV